MNDLWVRRYHPAPEATTRLVCLPHAGGSASFYFPFSRALGSTVEAVAVQYPGRQDRHTEPLADSISELADGVTKALGDWTDLPVALFGHSMGALVGYEVARRTPGVTALFVSGRRAPHLLREESVHTRTDDGIIAELKSLSGTEQRIFGDEELLRMVLPALRADYRAVETYRHEPGPPLDVPVHALTGDDDPKARVPEVREWERHTTRSFTLTTFSGGHFYLARHQQAIVGLVERTLAG
ncbi:thioesterase II family protein [Lentzea sp. NPDC060358]|uniref:thioesterase II family protein n=1 Tax=Lentzea sp. NPDC060358 TaxID=3347103 RepID=UPI0036567783